MVGQTMPHPRHLNLQMQAHTVEGLCRLIQLRIWGWDVILDGLGVSTKHSFIEGGPEGSQR